MPTPFRLAGAVGANVRVGRNDVLRTKRALHRLGYYVPFSGEIDHIADGAMLDGLKAFQKDNGLAASGAVRSADATERLLRAALFETDNGVPGNGAPAFAVGASVGSGGANRPADVAAAKRALGLMDIIPAEAVGLSMAPRTFDGAIALFQRAFNLNQDGRIVPGGETESMLARVVRPDLARRPLFDSPAEHNPDTKNGIIRRAPDNSPEHRKTAPTLAETSPVDGNPANLGPVRGKSEIDRIEEKFWKIAHHGRKEGNILAADMLERFLFADGGKETVQPDRLRAFPAVRDAEEVNRKRFERDRSDRDSLAFKKISRLKDGQSATVEKRTGEGMKGDPYFDRQIELGMSARFLSPKDTDLAAASGSSTLTSVGKFRATRKGNKIFVTGTVTHTWKDRYDWDDAGVGWTYIPGFGVIRDREGRKLEAAGRAKSFDMESKWRQGV